MKTPPVQNGDRQPATIPVNRLNQNNRYDLHTSYDEDDSYTYCLWKRDGGYLFMLTPSGTLMMRMKKQKR